MTSKNKRNNPDGLVLMKYSPRLKRSLVASHLIRWPLDLPSKKRSRHQDALYSVPAEKG
ncbi:50S ribosomal protein L33 [Peribacillus frigoritolerans]|nr:50S ribosomal protein L33 [Peribacillus frigoritolerans]